MGTVQSENHNGYTQPQEQFKLAKLSRKGILHPTTPLTLTMFSLALVALELFITLWLLFVNVVTALLLPAPVSPYASLFAKTSVLNSTLTL